VRGSRRDRRGRRKSGGSAVRHPPRAIPDPVARDKSSRGLGEGRPGAQLRPDAWSAQSAISQGRTAWFFWARFIGSTRTVVRVLEIPPQKLRGRERVSAGFAGGARFGHGTVFCLRRESDPIPWASRLCQRETPSKQKPASATATAIVSLWTSRPTYLCSVGMCWSPVWVVWVNPFDMLRAGAATVRIGSPWGSIPRSRGPTLSFPLASVTQL
jgi:hypothetical protein